MKQKIISLLLLCALALVTSGLFALANESPDTIATISQPDVGLVPVAEVSPETEAPDTAAIISQSDESIAPATEISPETDASVETDVSAETEASADVIPYTPDKVILTSSAWDNALGEVVTGEFDSIADALLALNAPYDLYYPAWDGGHLELYGGHQLILLHNPVYVMDPTTGNSSIYPSVQMNYQTDRIICFKIVLGYAPEKAVDTYEDSFLFGDSLFHVSSFTNIVTGESFYTVFGSIDGCYYSISAYSLADAKEMLYSIIKA